MSAAVTNGPFVIGYTFCFMFMGALAVQAYIYYTRFADDRIAMKTFVTGILILETLITVLTFYTFWESSTFSSNESIYPLIPAPYGPGVGWAFMASAPITGLVTTLTHGFFCWRIATLRKSRLLPLPIMMVSLLQLASVISLAYTDELFPSNGTISITSSQALEVQYVISPWLVIWLVSGVACDLAITLCLVLSLHSSKFYFGSNKPILVKLTRLTIETGLVTTIAALVELVLGIVYSEYFYHIAVYYAISKLYANCLLANLNFRLILRSTCDPTRTVIVWDDAESSAQSMQLPLHAPQIHVHIESSVDASSDLRETGPRSGSSIEIAVSMACKNSERLTEV